LRRHAAGERRAAPQGMSTTMLKRLFILFGLLSLSLPAHAALLSQTIAVNGTTRTYLLYVPKSYRATKPSPLVVGLHGGFQSAQDFATMVNFGPMAELDRWILVYPQGLAGETWDSGTEPPHTVAEAQKVDDTGFILALIDSLETQYNINDQRIYATGISNGGRMAYSLACDTTRFRAIAPVAAPLSDATCTPSAGVSVLHVHGTADDVNPFLGGVTFGDVVPPSMNALDLWARQDGCQLPIQGPQPGVSGFIGCAPGYQVQLRLITGGRHAWRMPGFNTTQQIWAFFKAQS
jgi:polyhydroxybutyrate depolymerase